MRAARPGDAPAIEGLLGRGFDALLVWVLETNPYRAFYEVLGGRLVGRKTDEEEGVELVDVAYGWDELSALRLRLKP